MQTDIEKRLAEMGLNVQAEFVPFSKSRNAGTDNISDKPWQSLNWKVTLQRNGRDILTTNYSAGVAHCPGHAAKSVPPSFQAHDYHNASGKPYQGTTSAYRKPSEYERLSQYRKAIAAAECESGFAMELDPFGHGRENVFKVKRRKGEDGKSETIAITPKLADVVHSLVMDSSVLDSGGFSEWASELGYDTDSRKAESIYRECLELALKLRAGLGESLLSELRELFQDY